MLEVHDASSYSKIFVFVRLVYASEKPAFSKTSTLNNIFKKIRFQRRFSLDTCGRKAKQEKTCGRGHKYNHAKLLKWYIPS